MKHGNAKKGANTADKKQLAIQQADAKRKLRLGHYQYLIENDDERKKPK